MAALREEDIGSQRSGADAVVELRGHFAWKRFHSAARFAHEAGILRQIPRHSSILSMLEEIPDAQALRFRRYPTDLMRALLDELDVPIEMCSRGVLSAVAYCHRLGLVHRDVKPENILLDYDGHPVLCDFSRALFAPEPIFARFAGTRAYAAPEALLGRCCKGNDVWSTGVVLFCLVERLFPFDSTVEETSAAQAEGAAPCRGPLEFTSPRWAQPYPRFIRETIPQMLAEDADKRPTVREVCLREAQLGAAACSATEA